MEYHYPFLLDDMLVFTQAWPPKPGQPRFARKTAVHAYPLGTLAAGDSHCTEITDSSLWSQDAPATSVSRLGPNRAVAAFPARPQPGAVPITHLQAGTLEY